MSGLAKAICSNGLSSANVEAKYLRCLQRRGGVTVSGTFHGGRSSSLKASFWKLLKARTQETWVVKEESSNVIRSWYVSCHVTVLGLKTLEIYVCLYWCWSIIHQIYIIGDWYHREGLLPDAHPPPASAPLEFKTRWEVEISRWGACLSYPSLIPVGQSEIRCESTWDRRKEEPPSSEEGNINGKSEIQLNQIKMIVLDIPGYAVRTHNTAKLMGRYQFQTNKRFSITIPNIWMHSLFIMTRSIVQNSD